MIAIEQIKRVILANRNLVRNIEMVERPISWDDNLNYVLVGVRQSGKSFMLFQRIKELLAKGRSIDEIVYINFEDERLFGMDVSDFDNILQAHYQTNDCKPLLFLDEIQNIEHWEMFARRLANEKYRVVITGSNAKMLSREIATTLGGRYTIIDIYPYTFNEYLKASKVELGKNWLYNDREENSVMKTFDTYFHFGGFPETVDTTDKRSFISTLYRKIYLGDLVSRYKVRNENNIRLLVKKLAESIKQPSSFSRLASVVSSAGQRVSATTIADYLLYLQETLMIFSVPNFTAKFAEKETNKKYYFIDNGLLNLFLFDTDTSLLENLVAIELHRRYGDELYFYNQNVEVDFYVPEEGVAVQVSYSIDNYDTYEREVKALVKLSQRVKLKEAFIITYNEERVIENESINIKVVPVWKFIMDEENLC